MDINKLYTTVTPECYETLMGLLDDPTNDFWYAVEYDDGADPDQLRQAILRLQPGIGYLGDPNYNFNVYYDPEDDPIWEDALMSLDIELDCGTTAYYLLNSHQGVGGM